MIYRANDSTDTALFKVNYDIANALDDSHAVALITHLICRRPLIPLTKVSYCLYYMQSLFVHAKALSWLVKYLEARTQRVEIDDTISEPIPLTCGVLQ